MNPALKNEVLNLIDHLATQVENAEQSVPFLCNKIKYDSYQYSDLARNYLRRIVRQDALDSVQQLASYDNSNPAFCIPIIEFELPDFTNVGAVEYNVAWVKINKELRIWYLNLLYIQVLNTRTSRLARRPCGARAAANPPSGY